MKHLKIFLLAAIAVFSGNLLFAQNGQLASANEINQKRAEFLIAKSSNDAVTSKSDIATSNTNLSKETVGNESFRISPDIIGNDFTASFTTPKTGYATLLVSDISGRVVLKETVTVTKGSNTELINASHLKSGMYYVSLLNDQVNYKSKMQKM